MNKIVTSLFLLIMIASSVAANENFRYHYRTSVKKGDGVFSLLRRYHLASDKSNVTAFYELNKLDKNASLHADRQYILPIGVYSYNHTSIRSTIGIDDWDLASKIAKFNRALQASGVRSSTYQESGILWVPHHLVNMLPGNVEQVKTETVSRKIIREPLFGSKYEEVEVRSESLKGKIFYLISGHGGPDPGAMGLRLANKLAEDEYAYDVTLRLARNLMEHGATVEIIIQDEDDGIRDDEFLVDKKDEICVPDQSIPLNQLKRLKQRCDAVNALHKDYLKQGLLDHTVVAIHIDSRPIRQRTDVFFYYYEKSRTAKKVALNLHETFREKYKIHRSSGSYHGTVTSRNLYVLKNTNPKAVYIELANIQNPTDQVRITQSGNRQALANWIFEGLIK